MGGSVAGPPVSENHTGLLRTQRTEEPAPPPPPSGPRSTSCAPLLHSLFQGPRFMTSEYNSKYLKEPSHQPGRRSSSYPPTTHPYPQPLGRGSLGTPELAQHYEAISRKQKDIQAAWGNHLPQPDLNALGLPISKGQLTCLGWLLEACPSFCSPRLLSVLDSGTPTSTHDPGGSGLQILGAGSLPTSGTLSPWQPCGWGQLIPGQQGGLSFADLFQKNSIGAKEETGFTKESNKNPIIFQPPSQALPGDPVSQAGTH